VVRLELLEGSYAVARLAAGEAVPPGLLDAGRDAAAEEGRGTEGGRLVAVTRTGEELSIVAPLSLFDDERPKETQYRVDSGRSMQVGAPQRAFRVAGTLVHDLTGVLDAIAGPLADAGVPIFALSTFDTDYVLVPEERLADAVAALRGAGHEIDP
jgi:uncharacterized protein